jgi:FixJ family two-component response regulator
MSKPPIVYVVDDDLDVPKLIKMILHPLGFDVRVYASAEEFLEHAIEIQRQQDHARCLILDIVMPGLGGLGLLQRLVELKMQIPTIVVSGVGEVAIVVKAMKLGACDYIEKPIHRQILVERVEQALNEDTEKSVSRELASNLSQRLALLSEREREVYELLVSGASSKEIAATLQICLPTVTKHRLSIFEKMHVESAVELVRLAQVPPIASK